MGVYFQAQAIEWWWHEDRWHSKEHYKYLLWCVQIQRCLIEAGHLVYSPAAAFKGPWSDRMQAVNDLAIKMSDGFIHTTPPGVDAFGTQAEINYALGTATPVFHAPPGNAEAIKHLLLPLDDPYAKVRAKTAIPTRGSS